MQSPRPVLHEAMAHAPATHAIVAFETAAQVVPHPPQLVTVLSARSQPFVELPSQLPHPALQVDRHDPIEQLADAFARVGHATPHAPQSVVVRTFRSQPFATAASQSAKPVPQLEIRQPPATQTPVAFAGAQAEPHPPQWSSSVSRSTQSAPHSVTPRPPTL